MMYSRPQGLLSLVSATMSHGNHVIFVLGIILMNPSILSGYLLLSVKPSEVIDAKNNSVIHYFTRTVYSRIFKGTNMNEIVMKFVIPNKCT